MNKTGYKLIQQAHTTETHLNLLQMPCQNSTEPLQTGRRVEVHLVAVPVETLPTTKSNFPAYHSPISPESRRLEEAGTQKYI